MVKITDLNQITEILGKDKFFSRERVITALNELGANIPFEKEICFSSTLDISQPLPENWIVSFITSTPLTKIVQLCQNYEKLSWIHPDSIKAFPWDNQPSNNGYYIAANLEGLAGDHFIGNDEAVSKKLGAGHRAATPHELLELAFLLKLFTNKTALNSFVHCYKIDDAIFEIHGIRHDKKIKIEPMRGKFSFYPDRGVIPVKII
ncbi:MAG: hypothetical protein V1707_00780 [bacterium]